MNHLTPDDIEQGTALAPVLEIDFLELLALTRDMGLSDDQAKTLIETYWNVAMHFVKMGFGLHPVQLAQDAQKSPKNRHLCDVFLASQSENMVQLQYDNDDKTPFEDAGTQ
ncbi:MAG: hypothetical protein AAGH53_14005 [Pseudomonadota bacterium]